MDHQASSRRTSAVEIPSSSPPRPRRSSAQAGPSGSRKRRRLTNQTVSSSSSASQPENEQIESIDLTDVDENSAMAKVLARQREDAIASQQSSGSGNARSKLTAFKCPVCLDTPVDATTTVCGHLFCHKCIIQVLKYSEEQRSDHPGKTPKGACPSCRKPLARADTPGPKRNLVPLQIKLITKKRAEPAKQKNGAP
ncbi:hypothetical protein BDW62DRAFT_176503 [Aspergillus aurantiobrunneus]